MRLAYPQDGHNLEPSWKVFLEEFTDFSNFSPSATSPCNMCLCTGAAEEEPHVQAYLCPVPTSVQGGFQNIDPVVTECFRAQQAVTQIIKKSLCYGQGLFLNKFLLLAAIELEEMFSYSEETFVQALNGKMFDPTSAVSVFVCSILQFIAAGFTPQFVDVSQMDSTSYANGLNASLNALQEAFAARTKCGEADTLKKFELDLVIYGLCAFYTSLVCPFPLKRDGVLINGNYLPMLKGLGPIYIIFPLPSVINTTPKQMGYTNGPFSGFIANFFRENMYKISGLCKNIVEFYFDQIVLAKVGYLGNDALDVAHLFLKTGLPPRQCFVAPESLSNKQDELREALCAVVEEAAVEQLASNVKAYT